jgi:hypothetical protein
MGTNIPLRLFHIFFVGTLFLYVGINGQKSPAFIFPFLKYLGILIIAYHAYKAYTKISSGVSAWSNLLHIFLIGPLMVVIGFNGANTSRQYFEMLIIAGMAAIGYHGYHLLF